MVLRRGKCWPAAQKKVDAEAKGVEKYAAECKLKRKET